MFSSSPMSSHSAEWNSKPLTFREGQLTNMNNFILQGCLSLTDGSFYDGMWHNGKRSGLGTFCYSNGDVFQGAWRDDLMHGKVRFFCTQFSRIHFIDVSLSNQVLCECLLNCDSTMLRYSVIGDMHHSEIFFGFKPLPLTIPYFSVCICRIPYFNKIVQTNASNRL